MMNEDVPDMAWSYTVDEYDGMVILTGPAGTSENVRAGVETLFHPIGNLAVAENFLQLWRAMRAEHEPNDAFSTVSARVRWVDDELLEVQDIYDQFENFRMGAAEFEQVLVGLVEFMKTPEFQQRR